MHQRVGRLIDVSLEDERVAGAETFVAEKQRRREREEAQERAFAEEEAADTARREQTREDPRVYTP